MRRAPGWPVRKPQPHLLSGSTALSFAVAVGEHKVGMYVRMYVCMYVCMYVVLCSTTVCIL